MMTSASERTGKEPSQQADEESCSDKQNICVHEACSGIPQATAGLRELHKQYVASLDGPKVKVLCEFSPMACWELER